MINNEKFLKIEDYKNDTDRFVKEIDTKCKTLNNVYTDYIKEVTKNDNLMMSLDNLLYQIELTEYELKNLNMLYSNFLYKMYGQYYKLYIKILNYIDKEIDPLVFKDVKINYNYTPFNDLEINNYSFDQIKSLNNSILSILNSIIEFNKRELYKIEDEEIRIKRGINIFNLISEKKFEIDTSVERVNLYKNLLINCYEHQTKFLTRLILKVKLLYFQIDTDIEFETVTYKDNKSDNVLNKPCLIKNNTKRNFEKILLDNLDISVNTYKHNFIITYFKKFYIYFLKLLCIKQN